MKIGCLKSLPTQNLVQPGFQGLEVGYIILFVGF